MNERAFATPGTQEIFSTMPGIKQLEVAMVHKSSLSERFLYDLIKYTRGFIFLEIQATLFR